MANVSLEFIIIACSNCLAFLDSFLQLSSRSLICILLVLRIFHLVCSSQPSNFFLPSKDACYYLFKVGENPRISIPDPLKLYTLLLNQGTTINIVSLYVGITAQSQLRCCCQVLLLLFTPPWSPLLLSVYVGQSRSAIRLEFPLVSPLMKNFTQWNPGDVPITLFRRSLLSIEKRQSLYYTSPFSHLLLC